jgi:hypothetical protein
VAESGPPADETLIRQVARVLYRCDRGDWAGAMEAWDEDEPRDTAYHRTARALYEAGLLRGGPPADERQQAEPDKAVVVAALEWERVAIAFAGLYLMALNGSVCDPTDACSHCSYYFELGKGALDKFDPEWGSLSRGGPHVQLTDDGLERFVGAPREALHPQPDNEGR